MIIIIIIIITFIIIIICLPTFETLKHLFFFSESRFSS